VEQVRQEWDGYLKDGYDRSDYNEIHAFRPSVGGICGYRMWQGEYRGIPIALYSCSYSRPWGADLGRISVILAVEETGLPLRVPYPNYSGPFIRAIVRPVAERRYEPSDIAAESILSIPGRANSWSIGQVRVETRDEGGGKLGFKVSATRTPQWEGFDLEAILKDENLTGTKTILPLKRPQYTAEEFAQAMIDKLVTFRVTANPWWGSVPLSSEMVSIDHPLWEDPAAVEQLLKKAPMKALVHAINFMERRSCKDERYLCCLESIDATLLGLASNESAEVRSAFGFLLRRTLLWPKDIRALEPLLMSPDPEIQSQVLNAFTSRGEIPRNMERVKELRNSTDHYVRSEVERMFRVLVK
jgi:hypothetical protein